MKCSKCEGLGFSLDELLPDGICWKCRMLKLDK
jgi:hypothetical protein